MWSPQKKWWISSDAAKYEVATTQNAKKTRTKKTSTNEVTVTDMGDTVVKVDFGKKNDE